MMAIILGQAHNASMDIYDHAILSESTVVRSKINDSTQHIDTDVIRMVTERVIYGFNYANAYAMHGWYCVEHQTADGKTSIIAIIWVSGFTLRCWLLLLASGVLGAYLFSAKSLRRVCWNRTIFIRHLLQILSILFGQGVVVKSKAIIIVMFAAFFLSNLYGNSITSLLVAPTPYQPFQTVVNAIEAGYKRMWFKTFLPAGKKNFMILLPPSLKAKEEHIFYDSEIPSTSDEYFEEMLANNLFGHGVAHGIHFLREKATRYLRAKRNLTTGIECPYMPTSIESMMFVSKTYTVNRKWLGETISRLRESGLARKYEQFGSWTRFLHIFAKPEEFIRRPDLQHDLIEYRHFMAPTLLLLVLLLITMCVFLYETKEKVVKAFKFIAIKFVFDFIFFRKNRVKRVNG